MTMDVSGETPAARTPARLVYLDVVRGLAVVIMVLAHIVDAWTRDSDRHDAAFFTAVFVGGLGAPLFLLLAGVAQAMSANARARRSDDHRDGAVAMWRRGVDVFVLAWLFRLQSHLLGWGPLRNLLKVDVLNVMGLSMIVAAVVWGASRSRARRIALFAVATAVATFATPIVRGLAWLGVLPDPIEAYLRPADGYGAFTMFPWAGFLLAGAIVGELVDATRAPRSDTRLHVWLGVASVTGILLAWGASFLPSIYANATFWNSSPTFFFIRLGIVTALIPATWAHCRFWLEGPGEALASPAGAGAAVTRAVETLGRSSLFVYWIHVEMVYGLIAEPIKRTLPLAASIAATAALCWVLLLIVRAKNRWMQSVELPPRARIVAAVLR